jgi:hypothetical protein
LPAKRLLEEFTTNLRSYSSKAFSTVEFFYPKIAENLLSLGDRQVRLS